MKKIQLRIKFEQKESWRISQVAGKQIALDATGEEIASFLLDEKNQGDFQIVEGRKFVFRIFLNFINHFVKRFRIFERKEKIIQKQLEK